MERGFSIRAATVGDSAVIADFNRRLAWETEHLELPPEVVRPGVEAILADPAKGLYFVAVSEGRVVGQCCVTYEWSDWRNGNMWWFQSVYVEAGWRGRGVFRSLFDTVETAARAQGVVALRLYVEGDNGAAQEAYRRRGMEPTSYRVFHRDLR